MMSGSVKISGAVRKAILTTKERNSWTFQRFAEEITKRLPSDKRIGRGGVNQWTCENSGTPECIAMVNFKALYPLIRLDLQVLEWKPDSPRVKKFVDEFETDTTRQGKLFDTQDAGQTVEGASGGTEEAPKPPQETPAPPQEERIEGVVTMSIALHCQECHLPLKCDWSGDEPGVVLIEPCTFCIETSTEKALSTLISNAVKTSRD